MVILTLTHKQFSDTCAKMGWEVSGPSKVSFRKRIDAAWHCLTRKPFDIWMLEELPETPNLQDWIGFINVINT